MYTYRVRLATTKHYQVDVESDNPLTPAEIRRIAIEQARRQFDDSDEYEILEIETISEPPPPTTGG